MNYINGNLIILMISALIILPLLTAEILRTFGNHVKSRLVTNFGMNSQVAITNITHPFGPVSWRLIIYLVLIVIIASTGYGLSYADMYGVYSELPYWLGFLVVIIY